MQPERQAEFMDRAAKLKRVDAITFHGQLEALMARAAGVVAMGGYNTFCEVLSLDKRALIVPRTEPRLEQFIRASRAADLGLVSMLADDGQLRSGGDGRGAARAAAPEPALGSGGARPARGPEERRRAWSQPWIEQAARSRAERARDVSRIG